MLMVTCSVCSKDDDDKKDEKESKVEVISTTESGSIEMTGGYGLDVTPGSVPPNQNGNEGTISFSIETGVDKPGDLPLGVSKIGDYVYMGPDNFQFSWPIRIKFPASGASSTENLYICHYDPANSDWTYVLPSYIDSTNKIVGADVLNLGYCVLVKKDAALKRTSEETSNGGIRYTGSSGYYYTLTVITSNYKYPTASSWLGSSSGRTFSSGQLGPAGGPNPNVYGHLPQGNYTFWVSRTQPGTISQLPKTYTYSISASATIDNPLEYWGWGNIKENTWTTLQLPGGGEWKEGSPSEWGTPTATYGTGDFQATLTWVNNNQSGTDLDLHLYRTVGGVQDMHVYWSSEIASDSSFQLDRDWMEEEGNAVENIYSIKTPLPKGSYTLKVVHFSGDIPKSWNVRVIRNYSSKNYGNTMTSEDQEVTVSQFTIE